MGKSLQFFSIFGVLLFCIYILPVLEEEFRDSKVLANFQNEIHIKAFVCSRETTELSQNV